MKLIVFLFAFVWTQYGMASSPWHWDENQQFDIHRQTYVQSPEIVEDWSEIPDVHRDSGFTVNDFIWDPRVKLNQTEWTTVRYYQEKEHLNDYSCNKPHACLLYGLKKSTNNEAHSKENLLFLTPELIRMISNVSFLFTTEANSRCSSPPIFSLISNLF